MNILRRKDLMIIVCGILTVISLVVWGIMDSGGSSDNGNETADIIYYYGETCSHCKELSTFLEENKVSEKVSFVKKEVWKNKANNKEMMKKAQECGFPKEKLGVPFVYARGKCVVGTPDAIKLFKDEMSAGEKNADVSTEASQEKESLSASGN